MKLRRVATSLMASVFLMALSSCQSRTGSSAQCFPVSVHFTFTSSYCGGAEPPQEILDQLNVPQPMSGERVFFRAGTINDVDSAILGEATTSASGVVLISLPPGEYAVVFADKLDRTFVDQLIKEYGNGSAANEPIDRKCLENWLSTPALVITVVAKEENIFSQNIQKNCPWNAVPCSGFLGSPPP